MAKKMSIKQKEFVKAIIGELATLAAFYALLHTTSDEDDSSVVARARKLGTEFAETNKIVEAIEGNPFE